MHSTTTVPATVVRAFALVAAGLMCSGLLQAQSGAPKLRPGLWEHATTMKSQTGQMESAMQQMQASLASLPPEQRKMMEEMMAKQGLSAGLGGAGRSARVCLTQQDIDSDQMPSAGPGCTQQSRRSGDIWQMSFKCSGPPPSSGEGQMRADSPTAYRGSFKILTEVEGKPERMDMDISGRWLGADCGKVKPVPR